MRDEVGAVTLEPVVPVGKATPEVTDVTTAEDTGVEAGEEAGIEAGEETGEEAADEETTILDDEATAELLVATTEDGATELAGLGAVDEEAEREAQAAAAAF